MNDSGSTGAANADRIALGGLRLRGYHGVLDHERADGQDFVVDLVLTLDTSPAARSDALADTIDYGALALTVAGVVGGEPVNLLETLADRIARACLLDERLSCIEVTVHKPHAPIAVSFADVSVTVVRRRDGAHG